MIKPWSDPTWGGEGLFHSWVIVHQWDKPRHELEETESTEECHSLAFFLWLTHLPLIQLRTTYLGLAPPTVGWSFLHQLAINEMPHRHAPGHSDTGNLPVEIPSSQECSGFCQVDERFTVHRCKWYLFLKTDLTCLLLVWQVESV